MLRGIYTSLSPQDGPICLPSSGPACYRAGAVPNRAKPPKAKQRYATSLQQVAEYFKVAPQTVQYWRQKGMPGKSRGRYDLSKITLWRQQNIGPAYNGKEQKDPEEHRTERELKEKILEQDLILKEIKAQEAKKELMPRAEYHDRLRAAGQAISRALMAADDALAAKVVGLREKEGKLVIRDYMRKLCERLADL